MVASDHETPVIDGMSCADTRSREELAARSRPDLVETDLQPSAVCDEILGQPVPFGVGLVFRREWPVVAAVDIGCINRRLAADDDACTVAVGPDSSSPRDGW